MARKTDFQPLVSVVNYDITSSEDELGEIESANGQAFVYASSQLPAPRSPPEISGQCDSSTESESDSEEEADTNPYNTEPEASPLPLLPASTKVEKPQDQHAACRPLGISSSDEESALVGPSPKKVKAEIVSISNSSSEHEQDPALGEVAANKRRRAYALKMTELPAQVRRFLAASRSFHTRPHSLERSTPAVAPSTYDKAEERLLCFLGHAKDKARGLELTPDTFADSRLIETYLDFLREERQLCPATISNHAISLLYPLKYLHREDSPRYHSVPLICQLRRTATILQKQGVVDRPKTIEELQGLNRWLDWDEVLGALATQRLHFEAARSKKHKA